MAAFEIHPILEAGERPTRRIWYAISPEQTGENVPSGKVGPSASSFRRYSEGTSHVLVSAGATWEGPLGDLHQLTFTKCKFYCELHEKVLKTFGKGRYIKKLQAVVIMVTIHHYMTFCNFGMYLNKAEYNCEIHTTTHPLEIIQY